MEESIDVHIRSTSFHPWSILASGAEGRPTRGAVLPCDARSRASRPGECHIHCRSTSGKHRNRSPVADRSKRGPKSGGSWPFAAERELPPSQIARKAHVCRREVREFVGC